MDSRGPAGPADPTVISKLRADLRGLPLIYAIHRNDTKDLYIGSTVEPNIRFYNHLISGKDSNKFLQNAISKYGKDNFTLYVLHLIDLPLEASRKQKEEIMISFEQMYFDLLNPTYNFVKSAGRNRTGIFHSNESKLLMSSHMKGKNLSKYPINKGKQLSNEEKAPRGANLAPKGSRPAPRASALSINASQHRIKKVYLYDEYNNLVTIYNGLNIACKEEQCSKATMSNCIKNNTLFRGWTVKYD